MSSNWEAVIGLEIHAQLLTETKVFAPDKSEFSSEPNTHVSPVTLGLPGTLPVVNRNAIEMSVKIGLALGCKIRNTSVFARKHYFYPDLPKGYQISQFDKPLCEEGSITFSVDGEKKSVFIERAHMEEDAGKSSHKGGYSLIDYNRAGVPLLEIVSGPDMRSAKEAAEYARTVRRILRYLEVCDGNLEEGSMRCDCNVSVRPRGQEKLGTKVEIKNINSFKFIEKAIDYEISRQISLIEGGESISQETRLYDSGKNRTFSMRSKEEAQDYRYFPDPDLLPVKIADSYIEELREKLPELPIQKAERFQSQYSLPVYDSEVLTQEKEISEFFEETAKKSKNSKASSNWVMGEVLKSLNDEKKEVSGIPIKPEQLGELIGLIDSGEISGKIAKSIFQDMWKTGKNPKAVVAEKGLAQISDPKKIEELVDSVLSASPSQVEQYRAGKNKLFGFFVGQIMKQSKGQANPELVNKFLKEKLGP